MSGSGSNSAGRNVGTSSSLPPRSKNSIGNRIDIGWQHGTDVLGTGKKSEM